MIGSGGFDGLNRGGPRGGQPMPGPMPVLGGGKPPMAGGGKPFTGGPSGSPSPAPSGPVSAPVTPAPASSMPYGQKNDPGAYGAPGAPGSSPLGMWQDWLNKMGPYLAQQPVSQPNVESGGLSSLAPSPVSTGTAGYYGAGVAPSFDNRGFRFLNAQ